ncbi:aquaporin AQPAe.a-like isoform X2 [Anthonomus grandis grandis]|uniref:aquaporin AQPAe.a-like isoform X2 n=1 Tax=Anthonomus grandis grandis TaxID=2921223 RepID=UPI0021659772|nr:aquaporin AQPAe.a-like isoform X2 [Anthonomus grandis grandis]
MSPYIIIKSRYADARHLVYHFLEMVDRQFLQNGVVNGNHVGVAVISTADNQKQQHQKITEKVEKKSGWKVKVTDNLTLAERLTVFAGEVGGTAILVFLGCTGCVASKGIPPHLQISLTFGLAVMVAVQIFGHISGSHINPIVTVAAATLGNISLIQIPVYFFGQLLGAILGYGCLLAITPQHYVQSGSQEINGIVMKNPGVCSPGIHPEITVFQGFLAEFLITFILALVCCGVWDARNADKHDSVSIRFGLTIAVLAMAGGQYTGANMNPVRSFAPALLNGDWENHWVVYWIAPLLAGFLGALIYRILFQKPAPAKSEEIAEVIPLNDNNKA